MAKKQYVFKTGVVDFLGFNDQTTSTCDFNFVSRTGAAGAAYTYPTGETTYVNTKDAFDITYASDPLLNGKVKAIGYGWQKYTVERNIKAEIMVRGACGGHSASASGVLDQATGLYKTSGCRGGRGAKLIGKVQLLAGDVLYIAVGCRGWCQNTADWGATGGGASVILRVNPLGAFTFAPTGQKVDALFVAGGGGGSYDSPSLNNATQCGKDASPADGANTSGGVGANKPGGGGGLTGNGTGSYPGHAILSGNCYTPSSRTGKSNARSWPGGGGPYNGGGGGAGYSGGGSTADSAGGNGGTSYINPDYVEVLFRGYETDVSMNPYSIPGSIIITAGRDETEYILAKDEEGTKFFDLNESKWNLIPNQDELTPEDYETYGIAPAIDNLNGLIQGNVKFLVSSLNNEKKLTIDGFVNKQVIRSLFELDLTAIQTIKSWTVTGLHNSAVIKTAVSFDHGLTYHTLVGNIWTEIDINDREAFYNTGILLSEINTIPEVKWKEKIKGTIRFAFMVHQNDGYSNPVLTKFELVCDLVGAWEMGLPGVDYKYGYITPETAKITILTNGDYKINYLNRIS